MLGFVFPLYVVLAIETVLGVLLMLPAPLSTPAVFVCKLTNTQIGRTIFATLSTFLGLLLVSPLYEARQLHLAKKETIQAKAHPGADTAATIAAATEAPGEANAQLSASLNIAALSLMFLLRRLGLVIAEREELRARYGDTTAKADTRKPHKPVVAVQRPIAVTKVE